MSDFHYSNHALLSVAYLPPIDYFRAMIAYGGYAIERYENYQKQSYRNRCRIYSANGIIPLVIPVIRGESRQQCENSLHEQCNPQYKQLITEVKIDYSKQWQKQHWRAIHSAYKSTPFFDYYQDDLYPFYSSVKEERLFDLNTKLTSVILNILGLPAELNYTQNYQIYNPNDLRDSIHPKKGAPLNLKLVENGNSSIDSNTSVKKYHQLFADKYGFIENLSIIDLIFNEGPESILYL